MSNTRIFERSFAGGELSPEMYGRIDDAKYQTGAAKVSNFIPTPQGPAENRPGFAFVNSTKGNTTACLMPFTFNVNQTMVIELGQDYVRFHTLGQTLKYVTPSRNYKAPVSSADGLAFSVASPCVVTLAGHGFQDGDLVGFNAGALPVIP